MKIFEKAVKSFLEETFNQPVSARELKKLLSFIFKQLFDSLLKSKAFEFPKGYGSLRVKELKPFNIKLEDGQLKQIIGRSIVKYFAGNNVRRKLNE